LSHYFKSYHQNPLNRKRIPFRFLGVDVEFETHENIFSKDHVDDGTQLLLSSLPNLDQANSVLDLGCGYGVVGISLKKVYPHLSITCSDVNEDAIALSQINASLNQVDVSLIHSHGFEKIDSRFDWIVFNPPIRVGKEILYPLYADALAHLNPQGTLWMVIRKDKGALSTMKYITSLGAQVEKITQHRGFWILSCRSH
jgi:16S rRNA (guanine1207-N2)-methyltransferase